MEDETIQDTGSAENVIPEGGTAPGDTSSAEGPFQKEDAVELARDLNDKYVRLYAEFDNYKKRINKDKEELVKYGNESLLYELLPAIDNLELALKHASADAGTGLVQGVEMTLKEMQRTLEKFGLSRIEAAGKPFDPAVHHAMMQVQRDDIEDKMIVEELRAGYLFREKVLRPSLVSVSVRPRKPSEDLEACAGITDSETEESEIRTYDIEEEV
ncbi:MAG: nucleotide exchange factor GrpE [Nitrospirae bacterium]|nr:nucleotide exchange factor GrpE [Nitrospirota bacterium]